MCRQQSLLSQPKNQNYNKLIAHLEQKGWQFGERSKDKILIIANRRVAERANFVGLYKLASARYGDSANEALMKRENILIRLFVGSIDKKTSKERKSGIEHLIAYWEAKNYNGIVAFLKAYGTGNRLKATDTGGGNFFLRSHLDKTLITEKIEALEELRKTGTVKMVMDFIIEHKILKLQEGLQKYLSKLEVAPESIEDEKSRERQIKDLQFFNSVMSLPYTEFINLFKHTQNQTVFSTKHGTKGDEFRNVLVIIDDTSWKQMYNFQNYINDTEADANRKLRTKNLFYVSCSRAMENLVVFALSEFETDAQNVMRSWFTPDRVFSINDIAGV